MTGQPRIELTKKPRPVRPCARQDRGPSGRAESDLLCWRSASWLLRALRGPSPEYPSVGVKPRSLPRTAVTGRQGEVRAQEVLNGARGPKPY